MTGRRRNNLRLCAGGGDSHAGPRKKRAIADGHRGGAGAKVETSTKRRIPTVLTSAFVEERRYMRPLPPVRHVFGDLLQS